jgi:ATP-binding cassette subfamily C protein LapB
MYDTLKNSVQPEDIVVVATHRPSAVPFCDRVIVMQKGRVAADGDRDTVQAKLRAQVQRIKGEPA